jgi:peptidoglycan biosynthesis protein MviN/MurJ (putative lipid II flippase)
VVSKALKFLNREVGAVNQAALLLGIFTLLSQVLGLVRDRMFTSRLGAGIVSLMYITHRFRCLILFSILLRHLFLLRYLLPILLKITEEDGEVKKPTIFSVRFLLGFLF